MATHLSSASGWLRVIGLLLLLCSLLGWSAWWVICNVYEFAPRLTGWPLLVAWLVAIACLWRGPRRFWTPWLLAGLNGLAVLLQHRGWIDAHDRVWLPLVAAMVTVLLGPARPHKR